MAVSRSVCFAVGMRRSEGGEEMTACLRFNEGAAREGGSVGTATLRSCLSGPAAGARNDR